MKIKLDRIHVINTIQNIKSVLATTDDYLEGKKELVVQINTNLNIMNNLFDLIPQTLENFWSGHVLPFTEAEYELESSVQFCRMGFYKHAIVALRNVLELGLLSVYYDIGGQSHIDIQGWFKSVEQTPFRKKVFSKLRTNRNIEEFDKRCKLFSATSDLYTQLSNFAHTRGVSFSSRQLGRSNLSTFQEESFKKWLELMNQVLVVISAFHLLRYPVGLQYTPIFQKFGLNGPAGGFLEPNDSEEIKNIFTEEWLRNLQDISDNDSIAKSMSEQFLQMADISDEEIRTQIEESDKSQIEMSGYDIWQKNMLKIYKSFRNTDPEKYKEKQTYFKEMKKWAQEKNLLSLSAILEGKAQKPDQKKQG